MKEFFTRHGLPTARHVTFTDFAAAKAHVESIDYPVVVKCSGLAGGKGVLMPTNKEETIDALKQVMVDKVFGSAGDECVVEEACSGLEARWRLLRRRHRRLHARRAGPQARARRRPGAQHWRHGRLRARPA